MSAMSKDKAMEIWRGLSPALRFRILSTMGGISEDERRVINAAPKPTMEEYERAQFAAADVLRALVEPETKRETCMTDECAYPRVDGWRWCRRCLDSGKRNEPETESPMPHAWRCVAKGCGEIATHGHVHGEPDWCAEHAGDCPPCSVPR